MHIQAFVVSPIGSNCYVLAESETPGAQAVIIDPGHRDLQPVFDHIAKHQFEIVAIWCTHGHFDHMLGVDVARERYPVPVYLHKADLPVWDSAPQVCEMWLRQTVPPVRHPDSFWNDGTRVQLGRLEWTILHTPGHSPGSVCIVGDGVAFTGDTLFAGTIGRTDFPLSSPREMEASLARLQQLADDLVIYPGHGQHSTIGHEKRTNPFLQG
ncbi:MBL fold hydrolase [Alicyclobacillus contaminans]|uniref:MBL fold metallo-hydrolase n=1 Tax=Alicyclobacillus contaminans TaxID=392016 RepID=UPI000429B203|nr:MBL fold metallo-hydrolase [Alicyclobacillus contaminans]GMA51951.1 MBL fold hydrolase [Alicyclobacillus contaminans]